MSDPLGQTIRIAGVPLSATVVVAAACALVGAGVLVRESLPAFGSVFAPSERDSDVDPLAKYIAEHEKLFAQSEKRWDGRYVFFAPPAPKPPPPPPPPIVKPEDVKPPPIQPAPTTYGGQKPTGIFGDIVFFGTDKRLKVGEKAGDIEVLGLKPPFEVKLAWTKSGHERGEYTVSFWDGPISTGFGGVNPFPKSATSGFKDASSDAPKSGTSTADATETPKDGATPPARGALKPGERRPGDPKVDPKAASKADPKADPKSDPRTGAPVADPPKDAPPASEGAGEGAPPPETQPADRPRRRYPPGQEPKGEPKGEANAQKEESNQGELVPLEKLPPFRSESDIKSMSKQNAQAALQKINEALALPNVDTHNRARLENDAKLIADHLHSGK